MLANMSLSDSIFDFLATVTDNENIAREPSSFAQAITSLYLGKPVPEIFQFSLDDKATADVISNLKNILKTNCPDKLKSLNPPLTYLFDELICNIQLIIICTISFNIFIFNYISSILKSVFE